MLHWPHCMTMVMIMIDNVDVIADDGDVHEYVDVVDGLGQPNSPGEAKCCNQCILAELFLKYLSTDREKRSQEGIELQGWPRHCQRQSWGEHFHCLVHCDHDDHDDHDDHEDHGEEEEFDDAADEIKRYCSKST